MGNLNCLCCKIPTAYCSLLHQISPCHTSRKPHLPTNQVLHLGMLIMHIFCVVISPFCSFSCLKLRKESAMEQREWFSCITEQFDPDMSLNRVFHSFPSHGVYQSCPSALEFSMCCSRLWSSLVNVRPGSFQRKLDWRFCSRWTPVTFHPSEEH